MSSPPPSTVLIRLAMMLMLLPPMLMLPSPCSRDPSLGSPGKTTPSTLRFQSQDLLATVRWTEVTTRTPRLSARLPHLHGRWCRWARQVQLPLPQRNPLQPELLHLRLVVQLRLLHRRGALLPQRRDCSREGRPCWSWC